MTNQLIEQPAPVATESRPRRTILIVEDDDSIAEALALRLEQQGFEAIRASLGRQGLSLAQQRHPHLVLLDLRLPDIDGFTLCQELDSDPQTCLIPKIVLSAMERPDIIRVARAAGCQFYVRKPYDPNALLILIEQCLLESEL